MKKLISMLLVMAMVLSMASVTFAAETSFSDVAEGTFAYKPVLWAVENGITNGVGDGKFGPNESCTRGQVVTFLYRMAGEPELENPENPFKDVKEGSYCYDAVLWAVANNITKGTSETTFEPNLTCTRAQIVTFLYRYAYGDATGLENPFKDVEKNSYYDAILWAVANGITTGTSEGKFSPNDPCTRGQIVTFLYRHNAGQSIFVDPTETVSFEVPAGESRSYHGYLFDVTMTIEDVSEGVVVTFNDEVVEANADGDVVIAFPKAEGLGRPMPVEFFIENTTAKDANMKVTFEYPLGTVDNPAQLIIGENSAEIEAGNAAGYYYTWTATDDGLLTILMAGDIPWNYVINNVTSGKYGDSQYSNSVPYFNPGYAEVKKGDELQIIVNTFDPENVYEIPAGTINFTASFEKDAVIPKEEYIVSGYMLELGENDVELYNDFAYTTVFQFEPEEAGVYTFTADDESALVGYWGGNPSFCIDLTEEKTTSVEVTLENVGPSIMIGVSGVKSCTLKVEKTGEITPPPEVVWTTYENTAELPEEPYVLNLADDESLTYVDITEEHYMVYGDDGFYHLDDENGPVLYVDMDYIIDMSGLTSYGEMKMVTDYDENENPTHGIKYAPAVMEYLAVADATEKVYPLTSDLYMFYSIYGEYAGWWSESGFVTGSVEGTINVDTAWMFACCYVDNGGASEPSNDPINLYPPFPVALDELAAGASQDYLVYGVAGSDLIIANANASIVYEGTTYIPVDGVVTVSVPAAMNPMMAGPAAITVTNTGDAAVTFILDQVIPPAAEGTMENPAVLVEGENKVTIEAGSQGYFFSYINESNNGTITVTVAGDSWTYSLSNKTTSVSCDMHWHDDDPVVATETLEFAANDVIELVVNTYDPENMWAAPAGEITVTVVIEEEESADPIQAFPPFPITTNEIPAGESASYLIYGAAGSELTIASETVSVEFEGNTYTPVDGIVTIPVPAAMNPMMAMPALLTITNTGDTATAFVIGQIVPAAPEGSMENPAELKAGETTITIEAGSQGYFLNYVNEEAAGTITVTVAGDSWTYSLANTTSSISCEMHWHDDDPVVATESIAFAAGDVVELMVNTYDPDNMWAAPAGEITITVTITPAG